MEKKRFEKNILNTLLVAMMSVVTIMILYPLFFVLITSIKEYDDILFNPFGIKKVILENYSTAWTVGNFSQTFLNSTMVVCAALTGQVMVTAITAFAIGRLRFKGSEIIKFILLSCMFITGEMTTIPLFMLANNANLLGTIWVLIIPVVIGPPGVFVLLAVNHIKKTPIEIAEAAIIDGCSIPKLFTRIDLPMMRPILSLVAIMVFQGVWSDFMWPFITVYPYNPSGSNYTMPLGLINFQAQNNQAFGALSAGLCILTIPIVVLYCFCSKYFIEGVSAGAVKG